MQPHLESVRLALFQRSASMTKRPLSPGRGSTKAPAGAGGACGRGSGHRSGHSATSTCLRVVQHTPSPHCLDRCVLTPLTLRLEGDGAGGRVALAGVAQRGPGPLQRRGCVDLGTVGVPPCAAAGQQVVAALCGQGGGGKMEADMSLTDSGRAREAGHPRCSR